MSNTNKPLVGILMGSKSHWETMKNVADTLDKTSPASLKIVGDVIYNSLPEIDKRISAAK